MNGTANATLVALPDSVASSTVGPPIRFGLQPAAPIPPFVANAPATVSEPSTPNATGSVVNSIMPQATVANLRFPLYAVQLANDTASEGEINQFRDLDLPPDLLDERRPLASGYRAGIAIAQGFANDFCKERKTTDPMTIGDLRSEMVPVSTLRTVEAELVTLLVAKYAENPAAHTMFLPANALAAHKQFMSKPLKQYFYGGQWPDWVGVDAWWKYRAPDEVGDVSRIRDNKLLVPNTLSDTEKSTIVNAQKELRETYLHNLRRMYHVSYIVKMNYWAQQQGRPFLARETIDNAERFLYSDRSPVAVLEAKLAQLLVNLYLKSRVLILTSKFIHGTENPTVDLTVVYRDVMDPDLSILLHQLASKQPATA